MTAAERIRAVYAQRRATLSDERYSYFDDAYLYLAQERERALVRLFKRRGITSLGARDILEVGCGSGFWLRELIKLGARPDRLCGVDLLPDSLARARSLCAPEVSLTCADATRTGFPDGSFDLVLQSTVFSSILEAEVRRALAGEMLRLLRPHGAVLWYDARVGNPRNRDFAGVGRRELERLFPGCAITLEAVTLAPPIARRLAPRSRLACELLGKLPFLRTHYLALLTRS